MPSKRPRPLARVDQALRGPERKRELLLPDELVRMRRETDGILATSARLLKEMQLLIEEAERLRQRQEEFLKSREVAKKSAESEK